MFTDKTFLGALFVAVAGLLNFFFGVPVTEAEVTGLTEGTSLAVGGASSVVAIARGYWLRLKARSDAEPK